MLETILILGLIFWTVLAWLFYSGRAQKVDNS